MKVIAIADDDSLVGHLDVTQPDLLISLGDIWDNTIEKAFTNYQCSKVFAVRGNHDTAAPFKEPVQDLHMSVAAIDGVTFGGFGGSWKYKPRGHHLYEQWEVSGALASFPKVDVFIAHNSPRGVHERDGEVHQGFDAFRDYIERAKPRYFLHGHQHLEQRSTMGSTQIIGIFGEAELDLF